MRGEGVRLIYHINELSFIGFSDVIRNISLIRSVEGTIKTLLQVKKPKVVVLIDFPGLNLRIAKYAKESKIPVVYYIAPQVWAWGKYRLKKMRKFVDKALVILPFESDFFKNEGVDAEFVGHPILDMIESTEERDSFCERTGLDPKKKVLAMFPGSREREVVNHLSVMTRAAGRLMNEYGIQPVIGVSPNLDSGFIRSLIPGEYRSIPLLTGENYNLLRHAEIAFVKSGTTTLEAACFKTPMLVIYKISKINYLVGKLIVNLRHFSLVNILAGEEIVRELSQRDVNPETLYSGGKALLNNESMRIEMKEKLDKVRSMLGKPGASKKAAVRVLETAGIL